jgi:hypothetical protein
VPLDYPDWLVDLRHHWAGADDHADDADPDQPERTPHDRSHDEDGTTP